MADPRIKITLSGLTLPNSILRFEIHKTFSKHSVAVVDIESNPGDVDFPEWTPAVVDLSSGVISSRWYGYVNHAGSADDNRAADPVSSVTRYTLIGTSLPMNNQRQRSWKHFTRSAVVRAVGREHGFRTLVQKDGHILPYIAQAGESDWTLLCRMATESGYRLFIDGSTILFADPDLLLSSALGLGIAAFRKDSIAGRPDTLVAWSTKEGLMAPRGDEIGGTQRITGLDKRTHRVLSTSGQSSNVSTPTLTQINTSKTTGSWTDIHQAVTAAAKRTRAWVTAKAVVAFSPDLKPGDLVTIDGAAIKQSDKGLWLVTSATHRALLDGSAHGFEYLTTLELERNDTGGPVFRATARTINTTETVACRMGNVNVWVSNVLEDVNVGII